MRRQARGAGVHREAHSGAGDPRPPRPALGAAAARQGAQAAPNWVGLLTRRAVLAGSARRVVRFVCNGRDSGIYRRRGDRTGVRGISLPGPRPPRWAVRQRRPWLNVLDSVGRDVIACLPRRGDVRLRARRFSKGRRRASSTGCGRQVTRSERCGTGPVSV